MFKFKSDNPDKSVIFQTMYEHDRRKFSIENNIPNETQNKEKILISCGEFMLTNDERTLESYRQLEHTLKLQLHNLRTCISFSELLIHDKITIVASEEQ